MDPLRSLPWRYRLVLRLLPAHVRDEHARELRDDVLEQRPAMGAFTLDVLRGAATAHWDILRRDVIVAARSLRRARAYALVAGVTLALGVGGNVAFFSLLDGVVLRQLPFVGADRLVEVTEEHPARGLRRFGISPANFRDVTRDSATFESAAIHHGRGATVRIGELRERVSYSAVGAEFFRVFRDRPLHGRGLDASADAQDRGVVVLGFAFWRRVFGSDPTVVGREMEVDGERVRVIGVMPESFTFPSPATAFWRPMAPGAAEGERRGARSVSGVARLRPDVAVSTAAAAGARTGEALAAAHPRTNAGWVIAVRELRAARVGDVRGPLLLVWGAGLLVLLIAVANVTSLALARAVARERELALRIALGARVRRLVRQLVTESALLAGIGTAAGLGLAVLLLERLRPLASDFVPRMHEVAVDARAAGYAVLLAVVTTLALSGVALVSTRRDRLWGALGGTRGGSASPRRRRAQRAIVVAQVSLAAFVLVASALVVRTLRGVLDQPMGFDSRALTTFRIEPPWRVTLTDTIPVLVDRIVADRRRAIAGYALLRERLRAIPGVREVGMVNRLPLTGNYWMSGFRLPERPDDEARMPTYARSVTPGYFAAMGTRLLRGRAIGEGDVEAGERVVVVDAAFAQRAWGDADPIGREVLLDGPPGGVLPRARVVGVVETVHMNRLDGELHPTMYLPFAQGGEGHYLDWGMDVVVRGTSALDDARLREAAREAFPDAVVFRVASIDEIVARSTADRRFQLLVLGAFGVLALALTIVGVGGTLILAVRERREELAVRLALGAGPSRLWWGVQRDALLLTGGGAAIGLIAAIAGARVFASLVHGVPARDPIALAGAFGVVLGAAFVAAAIPATQAMRVDPRAVLRD